jgi:hypothetical protein
MNDGQEHAQQAQIDIAKGYGIGRAFGRSDHTLSNTQLNMET